MGRFISAVKQEDHFGRAWYTPDIRPGDLIRHRRKGCCGGIEGGRYSILYRVIMVRGPVNYASAIVVRLDQHRRNDEKFQISLYYLSRGDLVKRVHLEPICLGRRLVA